MGDGSTLVGGAIAGFLRGYLGARERASEKAAREDAAKRQAASWLLSNVGTFSESQPGQDALKALLGSLVSPQEQAKPSLIERGARKVAGKPKGQGPGPQQGLDAFKNLLDKYPIYEKPGATTTQTVPSELPPVPETGKPSTATVTQTAPPTPGVFKIPPVPVSQMDLERMKEEARLKERRETEESAERRHQETLQETRRYRSDELKLRYDQLSQRISEAKQRAQQASINEADRRAYQKELIDLRRDQLDAMVELRTLSLQQKAEKVPATLAGRVAQAEVIKAQIENVRQLLSGVSAYMGPVVGLGSPITHLVSGKVQEFYAAQQSLNSLLPILHGYRGGKQTHDVFTQAMGTLRMRPEAYEGTLRALDSLADDVIKQVKDQYPSDPMWKSLADQSNVSPPGATHIVPGPDGKNHYTNDSGTIDYGVAP